MRNVLNILLPLAAAGVLAALALFNRPAAVLSAPPLEVRLPKESAKKPTTRPAGDIRRPPPTVRAPRAIVAR